MGKSTVLCALEPTGRPAGRLGTRAASIQRQPDNDGDIEVKTPRAAGETQRNAAATKASLFIRNPCSNNQTDNILIGVGVAVALSPRAAWIANTPRDSRAGATQRSPLRAQSTVGFPIGGHVNVLSDYKENGREENIKC